MERTTYMQKKRKGGFTLAEFLVVIAITTILAGVSFVTAIHYQSRLRRLEMDQTAKEIFLAAQNRLSLEKAGGSLERLLAEYPDLDGIMANDLCASSFLKTARELNRKVPQQLKIIAYDGTYITDFNYRTIASIRQDVALIAREAVQVLVKLINGQPLGNEAVYVPVSYKDGDTI